MSEANNLQIIGYKTLLKQASFHAYFLGGYVQKEGRKITTAKVTQT